MKKRNLTSLKLNKKSISNFGYEAVKGGATMTCCNYSCSCDTVDPDLTADCNWR
jgi:hypothetical protein